MDKLLHFVIGAALAMPPLPLEQRVALVVAPAILKELYDKHRGGRADWRDAVATVAGGATMIYFVYEW